MQRGVWTSAVFGGIFGGIEKCRLKSTAVPLSDITVKKARPKERPYKMGDSGGLYVLIATTGSRYWRMDYRFAGKHKTVALGVYPAVSLAAARKRRDEAREKIAGGIDPAIAKKVAKREARYQAAITFEAIAREWLDHQRTPLD